MTPFFTAFDHKKWENPYFSGSWCSGHFLSTKQPIDKWAGRMHDWGAIVLAFKLQHPRITYGPTRSPTGEGMFSSVPIFCDRNPSRNVNRLFVPGLPLCVQPCTQPGQYHHYTTQYDVYAHWFPMPALIDDTTHLLRWGVVPIHACKDAMKKRVFPSCDRSRYAWLQVTDKRNIAHGVRACPNCTCFAFITKMATLYDLVAWPATIRPWPGFGPGRCSHFCDRSPIPDILEGMGGIQAVWCIL
jgi:hypothetical protein